MGILTTLAKPATAMNLRFLTAAWKRAAVIVSLLRARMSAAITVLAWKTIQTIQPRMAARPASSRLMSGIFSARARVLAEGILIICVLIRPTALTLRAYAVLISQPRPQILARIAAPRTAIVFLIAAAEIAVPSLMISALATLYLAIFPLKHG